MTDERIKELRDEYLKCYKLKYGIEPMWAWGKNEKLIQSIWKWADQQGLDSG